MKGKDWGAELVRRCIADGRLPVDVLERGRAAPVALSQPVPPGVETPAKGRGRQQNKTETRWQQALQADALVKEARYEAVTLRLANGVRYTPDFFVQYADGAHGFDEVKNAFVRDAARLKYEWARQQYPSFRWRWCQWARGRWNVSEMAGSARLAR